MSDRLVSIEDRITILLKLLDRLYGGRSFGFLFGLTGSFGKKFLVDVYTNRKLFSVIRTLFTRHTIFWRRVKFLLSQFLQSRFGINVKLLLDYFRQERN